MLKILVADDEELERKSIENIIEKTYGERFRIYTARNGREAIEVCSDVIPDIMLIDIKMPGINGIQAIREIQTLCPQVYCMILTAYDYFEFAKEAVACHVKEYMLKPFQREELVQKLDHAIDVVQRQKEKRREEIENREKLSKFMPAVENELAYGIVHQCLESMDYEAFMRYMDFDLTCCYCMIIELDWEKAISQPIKKEKRKADILHYVKEHINRKAKVIIGDRFIGKIVCFIQPLETEEKQYSKDSAERFSKQLEEKIEHRYGVAVKIGVGNPYDDLFRLHQSYEEALQSIELAHRPIPQEVEVQHDKQTFFEKVAQFIQEHYQQDLNLEAVAAQFNVSPYYFSREFKEYIGINFSDYITEYRMNKAKEILLSGNKNIKEICYEIGYKDPNYFSRAFKRYTGKSPSQFKDHV